jgi:hypothetical protein
VSKSRKVAAYMGRYLCHLAILGSCISVFDVEINVVFFWFVDGCEVERFVMLCVFEFIECLVRFIVDKNLKFILLLWFVF